MDHRTKDRNTKPLKNKIGDSLHHLGYGSCFSATTPKAQSRQDIIFVLDLNLCSKI